MDWDIAGFRIGALFGVPLITSIFGTLPLILQRFIQADSIRDRLLSLGNAFAGGLFLGGGLVHLLAESEEIYKTELPDYDMIPWAMILCPIGFLAAFFIEKVLFLQDHHYENVGESSPKAVADEAEYGTFAKGDENSEADIQHAAENRANVTHSVVQAPEDKHDHFNLSALAANSNALLPYILVIVLSVHSVVSGLAVGIQGDVDSALPVFIAVIAHKWIEAFALGVSLLRAKASIKTSLKMIGAFSLSTPLGILLGSILSFAIDGHAGEITTATLTAIASGTFIYVAIVDIMLREFVVSKDKYLKFALVIFGFAAMSSLVLVFDHDHGNDAYDDHGH